MMDVCREKGRGREVSGSRVREEGGRVMRAWEVVDGRRKTPSGDDLKRRVELSRVVAV